MYTVTYTDNKKTRKEFLNFLLHQKVFHAGGNTVKVRFNSLRKAYKLLGIMELRSHLINIGIIRINILKNIKYGAGCHG